MTQRNDPCPCGSGKKYKKCCGDSSVPVARETPANVPAPAAPTGGEAAPAPSEAPFQYTTRGEGDPGGLERERHLKRRSRAPDLRGGFVYANRLPSRVRTAPDVPVPAPDDSGEGV